MTLNVIDVERLSALLEVFSVFDDIRWKTITNYSILNCFKEDLYPEEKLLTHYLCYIMDRQMPFRRIWDIGSYVISHFVHSYFSSTENTSSIFNSYVTRTAESAKTKLALECNIEKPNKILAGYGLLGGKVAFSSRYMPEDLVLMYQTLRILEEYFNKSFGHFLIQAIGDPLDPFNVEVGIKRLAFAFDQLTYNASGALRASEFENRIRKIDDKIRDFKLLIPDKPRYLLGRKRLWCTLRDYLKSPEFNPLFVACLEKAGHPFPEIWNRTSAKLKSALRALELPGDVWNNAEVFREGLFIPFVSNLPKAWDMPRTIREIYETISAERNLNFYPEQLDVTFDFVPRMCQTGLCDVCLFGGGIKKTCHERQGLLCPVVLYSCGYKHECEPSSCYLKSDAVMGYCYAYKR